MKIDLVVAGYIYDKDKVLLIHHKKLDLWLPVGGHIKENETPNDALLREIKEEIGIDVEIVNNNYFNNNGNVRKNLAVPFNVNVHSAGDHDHCCFFYVCKTVNGNKLKINRDELKNFEWLAKDQLNKPYIPKDVKTMALKGFELMGD